jgi:hypothetical protein
MRTAAQLSALLIWLAAAGSTVGADWARYADRALGFSIEAPSTGYVVIEKSESKLTLSRVTDGVHIEIFGGANIQQLSMGAFREMVEHADPHRRITYRAAGKNWFVTSGYLAKTGPDRDVIFYAKFRFDPRLAEFSAFEISYPENIKRRLDSTVVRMERSLTAPKLSR